MQSSIHNDVADAKIDSMHNYSLDATNVVIIDSLLSQNQFQHVVVDHLEKVIEIMHSNEVIIEQLLIVVF
jgi:hypothetical protein